MRSIEEYEAETRQALERAKRAELAALKRLKQRIARVVYSPLKPASLVRRDINRCIDEWHTAEAKRP